MLLGLLLAYVPISSIASLDPSQPAPGQSNRFPEILPLLLPATILVIPYADLLLAVVRRTRAGLSPLAPDRKHLHHRLLDIGHSHRSSVLIMYLWAALFSGAIVWLSIAKTQLFVFGVTTVAAMLVLLLMSMPRLRWWERAPPGEDRGGPGRRGPGGERADRTRDGPARRPGSARRPGPSRPRPARAGGGTRGALRAWRGPARPGRPAGCSGGDRRSAPPRRAPAAAPGGARPVSRTGAPARGSGPPARGSGPPALTRGPGPVMAGSWRDHELHSSR